jgi:hypothetical protein
MSAAGCQWDIDVYVSTIAQVHGDPYYFVSESALRNAADGLKRRIAGQGADSIQRIDCYFHLQELAAVIQDEHTSIVVPSGWRQFFPSVFPLEVRVIGDRFYVERDLSGGGIPRFSELSSINGRPMSEMLAIVTPFLNNTLRHYKMVSLEEDLDFWLQAYLRQPPPWSVRYRDRGRVLTATVDGITRDEYTEGRAEEDLYSTYDIAVNGETVPVLDIPRFMYPDKAAYEAFMDDFFGTHRDEQYLVIDLRRNPGGDGRWGFYVLDYLTDTDYETVKRFAHKVSEHYLQFTHHIILSYYHEQRVPRLLWHLPLYRWMDYYWKEEATKLLDADIGTHVELGGDLWDRDDKKVRFNGKVFLLTSHYTNSAAVVFAAVFKHHGLGLVIGRETGGRESFSSDPIFVELPNSTLLAKIPVAILTLPGNSPDRGVMPGIEVQYSIEDYEQERDVDLEAVKELIRTEQETT